MGGGLWSRDEDPEQSGERLQGVSLAPEDSSGPVFPRQPIVLTGNCVMLHFPSGGATVWLLHI